MERANHTFEGPLFIVGMPRSGTKLLRDLLNRHPQIGIPVAETDFIPHMVQRFGRQPALANEDRLQEFYGHFAKSGFFRYMQREGYIMPVEHLRDYAQLDDWNSIFGEILRFYAPGDRDRASIWGDKTPSYLLHMNLLKEIHPTAKFVHIIRDPRDCALSCKRTWGKSLYRAADRWANTIGQTRVQGQKMGADYMEVFFEELLDEPRTVLSTICDFLGCSYVEEMSRLARPSENLGDAKGQTRVVKANKGKYVKHLSATQIKRLDESVCTGARPLGYRIDDGIRSRPLNAISKTVLKAYDGIAFFRASVRERGVAQAIAWIAQEYKQSGWRYNART